jgi:hypothetical protein
MSLPTFAQETAESLPHATAIIGSSEHEQRLFLHHLAVSPHDTLFLAAAESGGIKEVRTFCAGLQLSPQFGPIRLGVIQEAQSLTPEAQNALLKLLEEPPVSVKIILFMRQEGSVLPTVLSRCRRYYAAPSASEQKKSLFTSSDVLEQFMQTESLAEKEDLRACVQADMTALYHTWCGQGRPLNRLDELERLWYVYEKLESNVNKRLVLEQFVISSL